MVEWETQLLEQWSPLLAEALHRVVIPEILDAEDLANVLSAGPASDPNVGAQLAMSFLRFWTGDGQGAAHTAMPMIEALVRNSGLAAERGIYRLQKAQQPGQYVGLGVLLDLFADGYVVTERDQRFPNAVLRHPGGWNLRNLLTHGYLPNAANWVGAITLYAALKIIVNASRGPRPDSGDVTEPEDVPRRADDPSDDDGGPDTLR